MPFSFDFCQRGEIRRGGDSRSLILEEILFSLYIWKVTFEKRKAETARIGSRNPILYRQNERSASECPPRWILSSRILSLSLSHPLPRLKEKKRDSAFWFIIPPSLLPRATLNEILDLVARFQAGRQLKRELENQMELGFYSAH